MASMFSIDMACASTIFMADCAFLWIVGPRHRYSWPAGESTRGRFPMPWAWAIPLRRKAKKDRLTNARAIAVVKADNWAAIIRVCDPETLATNWLVGRLPPQANQLATRW